MNNGTTLIERVSVVVVALAVVLSVVGGAAAVAEPSTEDGTLQDGGAAAGNVSSVNETMDEVDNVTDTAGGITGDDGQVEDDAIPTDGVDDVTGSPTGAGPLLPRETDDATGSDSTRQTRTSTDGSGTAGSADPASVGVTAGATNQTAIETAGEGPATLQFTENEPGDFPDNGTAHLTLPDDAGVTFDIANSSAVASGDNASATVTNVSATAVTIQVNSTDDANSSLRLEGLRFTVAAAASPANATWTFGNTSGATTVEPERLVFDGFDDDVPRGTAKVPEDETEIVVRAPDDARSTGFHESRDVIAIVIPDEYVDDVVFNTSSDVRVTSEGGDCGLPPSDVTRTSDEVLKTTSSTYSSGITIAMTSRLSWNPDRKSVV